MWVGNISDDKQTGIVVSSYCQVAGNVKIREMFPLSICVISESRDYVCVPLSYIVYRWACCPRLFLKTGGRVARISKIRGCNILRRRYSPSRISCPAVSGFPLNPCIIHGCLGLSALWMRIMSSYALTACMTSGLCHFSERYM